jgi:hypothetical protein
MNGCVKVCCLAVVVATVHVRASDATMTSLRAEHDVAPDIDANSEFWKNAPHVTAERDAYGKPVPRYATEVRSRWTAGYLYFLFICPYNELYLKPNPSTTTETNELWNWDVAEVFLGSDFRDIRHYKEFEISPQGEWVDLDVDLHKPHHEDGWTWNSGFQVAARIDRQAKTWYGTMRIPFSAIAADPPSPGTQFRVNLFRSEGPSPHTQDIAWQSPMSATFHTPERFGLLELVAPPDAAALGAARSDYLDDLIRQHDYVPGKNSFLVRGLIQGQRKTILDLKGGGSVRHIWSTWSVPGTESADSMTPPGAVRLLVFVDGSTTPAIDGPIDQLCRAAEATGTRYVPLPASIFKGAFNLYLPIFFERGVRIEVEALENLDEFYTQVDYRRSPLNTRKARLVSEETSSGLVLKYAGDDPPAVRPRSPDSTLRSGAVSGTELSLNGPGILRRLGFRGPSLDDATLRIYWDGEEAPSVEAPLRYFFADFVNAAMESEPKRMTCFFPMPFRHAARIVLHIPPGSSPPDAIEYAFESATIPANTPYFHAVYRASDQTNGYSQYPVVQVRGRGLFVGINLFDSGHNHGGGDAALIDAGTAQPHVLHGICGEDYFSFAWHKTGTMTPLTGAPVHERRYRLHLENPYPFRESFQLLFGVFAGLQPKSVAFWYQTREPTPPAEWLAPDVPWKALGPLGVETPVIGEVSAHAYDTQVPFKDLNQLHEQWQDADMIHGFADLTYLFRHFIFTSSGTGYVAGASHTELVTRVFTMSNQNVDALFGHDDAMVVSVNGAIIASLPAQQGFSPSAVQLPLRPGWNALHVLVSNDENVDWRWSGLSFAVRTAAARGLRFSTSPPDLTGTNATPARTP